MANRSPLDGGRALAAVALIGWLGWPVGVTAEADGGAAARPADGAAAEKVEGIEQIEEIQAVEEVEVVEPASAAAAPAGFGWAEALGRLHPLAVHLPIGWLLALLLFDLGGLVFGRPGLERAGLWLVVLSAAAALPAVLSGLLRAAELGARGAGGPLLVDHRNWMLATAALVVIAAGLRLGRRNRLPGPWRWAYLGLIAVACGALIWGGHLGGQLVYGQDFLKLPA